ncbi:hypothetical protein [Desulfofustis limnaeus]|jgi:hypothetical protein|uniref:Uncharacterized protein n=1 Tax=Desulfofustis limnaeus TaxID=2740163 RepID=A0ABM7W7S7_9BACT|nr:hypothetical protein [Desulfofustis limnaeus]BDD87015.1 hypothetical protein DPPLL_13800 [Desulfofustis limnaeus]
MPALLAIFCAFILGLFLCSKDIKPLTSWLLSCCVVPIFVLFSEFVLPYMGGGASMWPIALIVGVFLGLLAGGLGILLGTIIKGKTNKNT